MTDFDKVITDTEMEAPIPAKPPDPTSHNAWNNQNSFKNVLLRRKDLEGMEFQGIDN